MRKKAAGLIGASLPSRLAGEGQGPVARLVVETQEPGRDGAQKPEGEVLMVLEHIEHVLGIVAKMRDVAERILDGSLRPS